MFSKRVAFITLGCKVNQYETQLIREGFERLGYEEVSPKDPADCYVINTCTVTARSDQKGKKYIRQLKRQNPNAVLVVTGCYAERDPEGLSKMPEIDMVIGNAAKIDLAQIIHKVMNGEKPYSIPVGSVVPLDHKISDFKGHARAFVKIQDGCDLFCSYCIIPKVRGHLQSKPISVIKEEVEILVSKGYKEIVLSGIHLGSYGRETGKKFTLVNVIKELLDLKDLWRLRLSSLECNELSPEILELFISPKLASHLHLPIQSGSDEILSKMRRNYKVSDFLKICDDIRKKMESPAITTDVIVGFPGETDTHFEETLDSCRKASFSKIHIFPYADRHGTPASKLVPKVCESEKRRRVERLMMLEKQMGSDYKSQFIDKELDVVVEDDDEGEDRASGMLSGLTDRYFRVSFYGTESLKNQLVRVEIKKIVNGCAYGQIVAQHIS